MRARSVGILAVIATLGGSAAGLQAQPKRPPAAADYGKWESLVPQPRGGLSPDGRWLAYGINRSNRENELRVTNIADGATKTAAFGLQPVFSADSKWIAYGIGLSEAQEEKLRRQKKPTQRKAAILNLASGETATIDGVESFAFDAAGTHLALRRYPIEKKDTPAPTTADDGSPAPGTTLVVRDLSRGRRSRTSSATTAIIIGAPASPRPTILKPGSSGWKCRCTRTWRLTSGTPRCSTCRT